MADKPHSDLEKRTAALERALERERAARQAAESLLETKSRELYDSNRELLQRNADLESARKSLVSVHETLRESYSTTVEVFARLVQSRAGLSSRTSVATDAVALGEQLGLDQNTCEDLKKAALLCDVGKLSLPDAAVRTPYNLLDANSQREYHRHPLIAEATLLSIAPLARAATIVRQHCERANGEGFPDKMPGSEIPLPARILAVTKAFADLLDGYIFDERLTIEEARDFLEQQKGERYDPDIVDHFLGWLDSKDRQEDEVREAKRTLGGLRSGAKVARDFCDQNGVLILAKGVRLTDAMIDKLAKLQLALEDSLFIYTEEY